MITLKTPSEVKTWRRKLSGEGAHRIPDGHMSVGFVPTMGALHEGHLSLVRESKAKSNVTIVSIFVNPLQFNNADDLKNYPRTLENDLAMLRSEGVDAVWLPDVQDLYPNGTEMIIQEKTLSKILCGEFRPGHFDGMLTVVMKLFQVVTPDYAFFGEKDFQQLALIQKMVAEFFLDLKIIPVATLRETSGLAMSSRNVRLTASEREKAPLLYRALKDSKSNEEARETLSREGFRVEYVEELNNHRLAAAWLGNVRLIDNVEV